MKKLLLDKADHYGTGFLQVEQLLESGIVMHLSRRRHEEALIVKLIRRVDCLYYT